MNPTNCPLLSRRTDKFCPPQLSLAYVFLERSKQCLNHGLFSLFLLQYDLPQRVEKLLSKFNPPKHFLLQNHKLYHFKFVFSWPRHQRKLFCSEKNVNLALKDQTKIMGSYFSVQCLVSCLFLLTRREFIMIREKHYTFVHYLTIP